eukprot:XP_005016404.2 uncharacterized protein LOC101795770 [Anas platyrhynchos]
MARCPQSPEGTGRWQGPHGAQRGDAPALPGPFPALLQNQGLPQAVFAGSRDDRGLCAWLGGAFPPGHPLRLLPAQLWAVPAARIPSGSVAQAQVQPHGAVVQGSTSVLSNGAVPSVSCAKGFRKTQGEKAQTLASPSLLPTPILPQEFKCQHPPATAHISQGPRQHEVRGCPPPRGDAHRLDGAASRHRLVLPAHPRHLRHSQPAEQMRQQLAVPPPPEVLPGCLRQEMPLAPAWHPHVPRVRARHRPRGFSASPCHLRYQPAARSPGRTVLLGTGTGTAPCPRSETSLAAEPAATGCCLLSAPSLFSLPCCCYK